MPKQLQANSNIIFPFVALLGKHSPPLLHNSNKHVNKLFTIPINMIIALHDTCKRPPYHVLPFLPCVSCWCKECPLTKLVRGEWGYFEPSGKLSHPLNSTKKAGENVFMTTIIWSYSKDLLHHACSTKMHLVAGKFQEKCIFRTFSKQ